MARETLGDQLDIHGGGADLIFPHHENEIAQSEALTGKEPFVRYWAHSGLVVLGAGENAGVKMAHSLENFTTIDAILERYTPLEVRYFLVATHYRSSLTFTLEGEDDDVRVRGLEDARGALGRLRRALGEEPLDRNGPVDAAAVEAFNAAMDADFNTPDALAVIFDLAREINRCRDSGAVPAELDQRRRALVQLLGVLGLDLGSDQPREQRSIEPYVALLLDVRRKLRDVKQWALADEIRTRLAELGVTVEDKPGGESAWRLER
jgi:cysteinyl-tRNA synthetase